MDAVRNYFETIPWRELVGTSLRIAVIIIVGVITSAIISTLLRRFQGRLRRKSEASGEPPGEADKRADTLARLVRQAAYIALWVAVFLVVLREAGIDIAPILAGAGIVGLAVGFGAQNLVRDIISGFFFILENQVRVGDVAVINGTGGMVEEINFRTIVLRDMAGTVHVFPNGAVTTLSNMTRDWSAYVFEVGVAYKERTDQVVEVIGEVLADLQNDPELGPAILEHEIMGVDALADSAVVVKGRIKTKPIRQWAVGREFLRRIKIVFDEKGIEIPFPHQTLYFGEASPPFDVSMTQKGA